MSKVNCKDCSQEDCAYYGMNNKTNCKDFVLKAQPAKQWVGLTDEELRQVWYDDASVEGGTYIDKLRQVEAKLKAKNSP